MMYDDLNSLTEKLKMPGVAFQQINTKPTNYETIETINTLTTSSTVAANHNPSHYQEKNTGLTLNPVSEKKHKRENQHTHIAPDIHKNLSDTMPTGTQKDTATSSHSTKTEEEHPIRLDVLFAIIKK